MKKIIYLSIISFFIFPIVHAHSQESVCYDDSVYAAEQMVRFHSQLMVIGMVCDPYSDAEKTNTYQQYQDFSKRHERLIRSYEQKMVDYYKKEKEGSAPERRLHNLRTQIANDLSRYAMRMTPPRFCGFFKSRLDQALAMSGGELNALVQTVNENQISLKPLCAKTVSSRQ